MSVREVLTDPNETLRVPSEPLSVEDILKPETQTLIDDMIETMYAEKGVGIAAPQIGIHKRIIIVDTGDGAHAFINPKISRKSIRKVESEEGCLSVPGVYGMVRRHKTCHLDAYTRDGRKISMKLKGFPSIVFQHETDHLNGILFIDNVFEYTNPPRM